MNDLPNGYKRDGDGMLILSSGNTDNEDFSRLDSLTRDELITLIKTLPGVSTAMLTKEEIGEAMMVKLAHTALTSRDVKDTLAAIKEWLDREHGKPMQRQQSLVATVDATKPMPENDRKALEHYFKIKGMINND